MYTKVSEYPEVPGLGKDTSLIAQSEVLLIQRSQSFNPGTNA